MCRLLGVIANKPVDLEFSLGRFRKHAEQNPDGWGIGWYDEGKAKIFKEAISALQTDKLPALSKQVKSKIIIAHVRKGTRGAPSEVNSHPFVYDNWIFAHNGSLDGDRLLHLLAEKYRSELKGETDSEIYFYWLLQCIEEKSGKVEDGIKAAIDEIMKGFYGGLNFLLSDGTNLYAFRYSKQSRGYYSLFVLERDPSQPALFEHISGETEALVKSKMLRGEKAVLVCSEKLTRERWKEIKPGNLLVIKGDLTFKEVNIV